MAQHALGSEYDKRLAPQAARLTAEHMEVLRGGGWLANLHVVFRGELHEALEPRAGMLRALAFIAVRQEQYDAGGQIPFVFTGADELVDDHLRAVGEIAELRLPQNERFRIVAAEPILETDAASLREGGIVNLAKRLLARQVRKRDVVVLGFRINQDGVALIEGGAFRVLPSEAHRRSFQNEGPVGQCFRKAIIDGALAVAHLGALLKKLDDLGMDVEALGNGHEGIGNLRELFARKAGIDFIGGIVLAVQVRRPIIWQLAQMRLLGELAGFQLFFFVFLFYGFDERHAINAGFLRVNFPEGQMIFYASVPAGLRGGGVGPLPSG